MLWVLISHMSGNIYDLKSNDRFYEKLLMAIFIYFQSLWQKSAERKSS